MTLHVLDTDILSLHQHGHPTVRSHCQSCKPDELAITVISVEEQLSGWYSLLRQAKQRQELALVYQSLAENVRFLAELPILSFTEPAIIRFEQLKTLKLNVRRMDLRIAAITLVHGGILVTRNQRIPGLTLEDWTV